MVLKHVPVDSYDVLHPCGISQTSFCPQKCIKTHRISNFERFSMKSAQNPLITVEERSLRVSVCLGWATNDGPSGVTSRLRFWACWSCPRSGQIWWLLPTNQRTSESWWLYEVSGSRTPSRTAPPPNPRYPIPAPPNHLPTPPHPPWHSDSDIWAFRFRWMGIDIHTWCAKSGPNIYYFYYFLVFLTFINYFIHFSRFFGLGVFIL